VEARKQDSVHQTNGSCQQSEAVWLFTSPKSDQTATTDMLYQYSLKQRGKQGEHTHTSLLTSPSTHIRPIIVYSLKIALA